MLNADRHVLMFAADWLLLVCIIAMLLYVFARKPEVARGSPNLGHILVFGGFLIIVSAYATKGLWLWLAPDTATADRLHAAPGLMSEWANWLLTRSSLVIIVVGVLLVVRQRSRMEHDIRSSEEQLKAVEQSVMMTEMRYKSLVDHTSDSVYCFEFEPPVPIDLPIEEQIRRSEDAQLVDCNSNFSRKFGCERPSELFGMKMSVMDSTKDHEAHRRLMTEFVRNNYRLNGHELIYKTPAGVDRALRLSMTGFVRDGLLHRFWAAERDILSFHRARSALHNSQQFTRLLADISSQLLVAGYDEVDEKIVHCMRRVCEFVEGERSAIVWINEESTVASIEYFWNEENEIPMRTFKMETFPNLARIILGGKPVSVDDVSKPAAGMQKDCENMQDLGIKSFAAVPMRTTERVVGALSISNWTYPRAWQNVDILMLKVFGDLFANVVLRVKSFRALNEALGGLQRATERLEAENVYLRQEIKSTHGFDEIIGQSDELLRSLQKVEQVADTDAPVLILGETGTGKELVARAVHKMSKRGEGPIIKVNCAALPAPLIESELFGHEKGAYTGANAARKGRFDLADGGTIFLDEIGDLPADVQAKLLRVLQEGEFERLGGSRTLKVDVRIVAATNRDLDLEVQEGRFRSDLLYRINTFPIELPPLRDRKGDVRILAEYFVRKHGTRLGADVSAISASMMRQLEEYQWPGNVRELESVIQRSLIATSGPVLDLAEPLAPSLRETADDPPRIISSTISDLHLVERNHIVSVLEESAWKISGKQGAAARLGIPPSTLRSKMKKLSIRRPA